MAKKGQKFANYTPEFKMAAVRLYLEEGLSYKAVAKQLGVPSHTQIRQWVKKYRNGDSLEDKRQRGIRKPAWRTGRPKTKFASIEEELAYVKAEVEYLKKQYPNLHGKR